MNDRRDVSGVWYGSFTASDPSIDPNTFIAMLTEHGGAIDGTVTEPDNWGRTGILRAFVRGVRAGPAVRFTKQYDGFGGVGHAVHYSGDIDDAGMEIRGEWQFEIYSGPS